MKFDDLDAKLRVFETASDTSVVPGLFMAARIDGRSFTRLTKEVHRFEAPFDERFRDYMVGTTAHLMDCGFRMIYGYTQSDEISLLFHKDENTFNRKLRKLHSVLAGEASAKFSLLLGDLGSFDCRVSQLPSEREVVEYFRWRSEDAHRNALNAHCYWALRREGATARGATHEMHGLSVAEKNELLFTKMQVNFNDLPNWQKAGVGLHWEDCEKVGRNPVTGAETTAVRKQLRIDYRLPVRQAYSDFMTELLRREDVPVETV